MEDSRMSLPLFIPEIMKRKWREYLEIRWLLIGVIAAVASIGFMNKWHYPSLPIESVTPREAIQKMNASELDLVEISRKGDEIWYIMELTKSGMEGIDDKIIAFLDGKGWSFTEKEGSGLFFEKDDERLIVSTEMWTKHYVLVRIPSQI